jgi:hypothetical protein
MKNLTYLLLLGLLLLAAPALAEPTLGHTPIAMAAEDQPVNLDFVITQTAELANATVHARSMNGGGWVDLPVRLSSSGGWRATVPAEMARDPGFQYWVEAVDMQGLHVTQFASAEVPHPVYVRASKISTGEWLTLRTLEGKRHEINVSGVWMDYRAVGATAGTASDIGPRFADFSASWRFWLLRGVEYLEVGVGRLRGTGPNASGGATSVGFDRGWADVSFAVSRDVALGARVILGGDESSFRGGGAGFIRFGGERATHLKLETGYTGGVGGHVLASVHSAALPTWPMWMEVELTTEPNNDAWGEILRYRLQHRLTDWLYAGGRVSYQSAHSNDHGLGAGADVQFRF